MHKVNIHEAKKHLSKLLEEVAKGEEVIISKAGKPVAKLVPVEKRTVKRKAGSMKGKIRISKDFDAPLPEDVLSGFEGRG